MLTVMYVPISCDSCKLKPRTRGSEESRVGRKECAGETNCVRGTRPTLDDDHVSNQKIKMLKTRVHRTCRPLPAWLSHPDPSEVVSWRWGNFEDFEILEIGPLPRAFRPPSFGIRLHKAAPSPCTTPHP